MIVYFGAAVIAAPLWPWLVRRHAKHRVWCWAMLYACAVFVLALLLREGDLVAFAAICVLSGAALGADLSLPTAIRRTSSISTPRDRASSARARSSRCGRWRRSSLWPAAGRVADPAGVDRLFRKRREHGLGPDRTVAALRPCADRAEARSRCADVELSARRRGAARPAPKDRKRGLTRRDHGLGRSPRSFHPVILRITAT